MADREIDTSDIPETADWRNAVIGKYYRPIKKQVSLRLDADILEWFKIQGGKYQTHIPLRLVRIDQVDLFQFDKPTIIILALQHVTAHAGKRAVFSFPVSMNS